MLTDAQLCQRLRSTNKQTSQQAWEQLLNRHNGIIRKLSSSPKYDCVGCTHDDMYQQAVMGFRYSCMTFDPQKKMVLLTHAHWGILKYCMMLKDKMKKASREVIVSQSESTHEQYQQVAIRRTPRYKRLSPQRFQTIKAIAITVGMSKEEMMTLKVAYRAGTPEKLKNCEDRLFNHWLRKSVTKTCAKLRKRMVDQESKWQQEELFEMSVS